MNTVRPVKSSPAFAPCKIGPTTADRLWEIAGKRPASRSRDEDAAAEEADQDTSCHHWN